MLVIWQCSVTVMDAICCCCWLTAYCSERDRPIRSRFCKTHSTRNRHASNAKNIMQPIMLLLLQKLFLIHCRIFISLPCLMANFSSSDFETFVSATVDILVTVAKSSTTCLNIATWHFSPLSEQCLQQSLADVGSCHIPSRRITSMALLSSANLHVLLCRAGTSAWTRMENQPPKLRISFSLTVHSNGNIICIRTAPQINGM